MKQGYTTLLYCIISFFSYAQQQTEIIPKGLIYPSFGLNGGDAYVNQIAVTSDNYICAAGKFTNTIDFDVTGDTFNISSTYEYNMFIAKYDAKSNLIFAFKLSGTGGYDDITTITTDKSGNIYVAGFFSKTVDFDPGPAVANLSTPGYLTHYMFFAKYDKEGNYLYAKPIASDRDINSLGSVTQVKTDEKENVYISGYGNPRSLDFDPGPQIVHAETHGKYDAFFAKYDSYGNYIFAKSIGSRDYDLSNGLAINKNKDIIVVGNFANAVNDFDPGSGTVTLPFKGESDIYVAQYDSAGNYKKAFALGGVRHDNANAVVTDKDGNIVINGLFYGNVDFDPGTAVSKILSDADYDFFIARYSEGLDLLFAKEIRASSPWQPSLAIDENENIYIGGVFEGTVLFSTTDSLVSNGSADAFVAKYSSSGFYKFSSHITGFSYKSITSIALRGNDQVFVAGNFSDTCYFISPKSKRLITQNYNAFIGLYNASTGHNISAGSLGTYRKFIPQSSIVKFAHDEQNNIYVAGTFQGIVDFDPEISRYVIASSQDAGSRQFFTSNTDDIFFAKYTASGKLVFAKNLGGTAGQSPISIAVDDSHCIYLAGVYEGAMDADPGENTVRLLQRHNPSIYDAYFIAKYDSSGNYIFANPLYLSGQLRALTIDKAHNIFITGNFNNGYFDAENDTSKISTVNNGSFVYFAKYDTDGKFIYLKDFGIKNKYQNCSGIQVNSLGNILIHGQIYGSQLDVDPGPGTYYADAGEQGGHFIAAYTANGDFLFENNGKSLKALSTSNAEFLSFDNQGNIYVSGNINGLMDMDSGPDTMLQNGNGEADIFFMKYAANGIPLFSKVISAFKYNSQYPDIDISSFTTDGNGDIYFGGRFTERIDFDPGDDTAFLYPDLSMKSNSNLYLSKYDSSGNYEYAYNFAPTDTVFFRSGFTADIWVGNNSDITWAVNTNGKIDFNPGDGTFYYNPPFDVYFTDNETYSFVLVKFKQLQKKSSFPIYVRLDKL